MSELNLRNYAYLGDAVWELYIREITVLKTQNAKELHKLTTEAVNARSQHDILMTIQGELTDEELEIMRRARNLPVPIGRKSNQAEYRISTAFEALIGWWYINDKGRLENILDEIRKNLFTKKN